MPPNRQCWSREKRGSGSGRDRATKVVLDKKGHGLPQRRLLCGGLFRRRIHSCGYLLLSGCRDRAELVSVGRAKDEEGDIISMNAPDEASGTGGTEAATLVVMGATKHRELLDGFIAAPFTARASGNKVMGDRLLREGIRHRMLLVLSQRDRSLVVRVA